MIKDQLLKIICIPFLGIIIPFFSGLITCQLYSGVELAAIFMSFIFMSFCIWTCAAWLHHKTRHLFTVQQNPFIKIGSISLINALFAAVITGIFSLVWFEILKENFTWDAMWKATCFTTLAVILFTLVYEILFLSRERELDTKIVDQLDLERSKAEMSVLKNELEPHFIFNSLNALSYLIATDPKIAHQFNSKLASVYKYFLINKDKDLITLENELEFIENYFFLLQVRYDNKLHFATECSNKPGSPLMILPYALQVAVENAVKHNEFTDEAPLYIKVVTNGEYILIKNNRLPKSYSASSTGIGLRNLSSRYKIVCYKDILIETNDYEYTIKLPIIKSNV